jgi:hypothetical protein
MYGFMLYNPGHWCQKLCFIGKPLMYLCITDCHLIKHKASNVLPVKHKNTSIKEGARTERYATAASCDLEIDKSRTTSL